MKPELRVARQAFETGQATKEKSHGTVYNKARAFNAYTQHRTLYEGVYDGKKIVVTISHQQRHGDRWFALPFKYWGDWRTHGQTTLTWTEADLRAALAGTGGYSNG
jgi:hypothetical protein